MRIGLDIDDTICYTNKVLMKYADKYNVWSTLRLYFDPLDKGVH